MVRVKPRSWWHVWSTPLRAKKEKGQRGWSCDIEADYCPDIAKNILLEYEKPQEERDTSRMVGLYAAVASYLPNSQLTPMPLRVLKATRDSISYLQVS